MEESSVKVAIRIRPQITREIIEQCKECVRYIPPNQVLLSKDKGFTFDSVFPADTSQEQIYNSCGAHSLVQKCFEGYNATILAYGQTGSGKTYTMGTFFSINDPEQNGIVVRAVDQIFQIIQFHEESNKKRLECSEEGAILNESQILLDSFELSVQFLELYNDEIIDLLNTNRSFAYPTSQIASTGGINVSLPNPQVGGRDGIGAGKQNHTTNATSLNSYTFSSFGISNNNNNNNHNLNTACPTVSIGGPNLKIQEDTFGNVYVNGLTTKRVTDKCQILKFLREGILCRTTGCTVLNSLSSRSHAIFTVLIKFCKRTIVKVSPSDQQQCNNDDVNTTSGHCLAREEETEEYMSCKLHFVDLAGSERLKRTGATGHRAKEGIHINCGLLALGNVISALGDKSKRATHIPYRDSKLTRLLQDSLGGNSHTLMIACVSPSDNDFVETLNTLNYANRAKNIKNKLFINKLDRDGGSRGNDLVNQIVIANLRAEVSKLRAEISALNNLKGPTGLGGRLSQTPSRDRDFNNNLDLIVQETTNLTHSIYGLDGACNSSLESAEVDTGDKSITLIREKLDCTRMALEYMINRNSKLYYKLKSRRYVDAALGDTMNGSCEDFRYKQILKSLKKSIKEKEALRCKIVELYSFLANIKSKTDTELPPFNQTKDANNSNDLTNLESYKSIVQNYLDFAMSELKNLKKSLSIEKINVDEIADFTTEEFMEEHSKMIANGAETSNQKDTSSTTSDTGEDTFHNISDTEPLVLLNGDVGVSDEPLDFEAAETATIASTSESLKLLNKLQDGIDEKIHLIKRLKRSQTKIRDLKTKYETQLTQLESRIEVLNVERERALKLIESDKGEETAKEYDDKIIELNKEVTRLKKAQKEHSGLMKNFKENQQKLSLLQSDILDLKQTKVKLMRKIKENHKSLKDLELRKEREINKLAKDVTAKDKTIQTLKADKIRRDDMLRSKMDELTNLRKMKQTSKQKGYDGPERLRWKANEKISFNQTKNTSLIKVSRTKNVEMEHFYKLNETHKGRIMELSSLTESEIKEKLLILLTNKITMKEAESEMDYWIAKREEIAKSLDNLKTAGLNETENEEQDYDTLGKELQNNMEFIQEKISNCQKLIVDQEAIAHSLNWPSFGAQTNAEIYANNISSRGVKKRAQTTLTSSNTIRIRQNLGKVKTRSFKDHADEKVATTENFLLNYALELLVDKCCENRRNTKHLQDLREQITRDQREYEVQKELLLYLLRNGNDDPLDPTHSSNNLTNHQLSPDIQQSGGCFKMFNNTLKSSSNVANSETEEQNGKHDSRASQNGCKSEMSFPSRCGSSLEDGSPDGNRFNMESIKALINEEFPDEFIFYRTGGDHEKVEGGGTPLTKLLANSIYSMASSHLNEELVSPTEEPRPSGPIKIKARNKIVTSKDLLYNPLNTASTDSVDKINLDEEECRAMNKFNFLISEPQGIANDGSQATRINLCDGMSFVSEGALTYVLDDDASTHSIDKLFTIPDTNQSHVKHLNGFTVLADPGPPDSSSIVNNNTEDKVKVGKGDRWPTGVSSGCSNCSNNNTNPIPPTKSTEFPLVLLKCMRGLHEKAILCLDVYDNMLFTGSKDRNAKVWDVPTGKIIRSVTPHPNHVTKCKYSPQTQLLITTSLSYIKLWDLRVRDHLHKIGNNLNSEPNCVSMFNSLGNTLSSHSTAVCENMGSNAAPSSLTNGVPPYEDVLSRSLDLPNVTDLAISSSYPIAYIASGNCVKIWDLNSFNCVNSITVTHPSSSVTCLSLITLQNMHRSCANSSQNGETISESHLNKRDYLTPLSDLLFVGTKDHNIKSFEITHGGLNVTAKTLYHPPHYDGLQFLDVSRCALINSHLELEDNNNNTIHTKESREDVGPTIVGFKLFSLTRDNCLKEWFIRRSQPSCYKYTSFQLQNPSTSFNPRTSLINCIRSAHKTYHHSSTSNYLDILFAGCKNGFLQLWSPSTSRSDQNYNHQESTLSDSHFQLRHQIKAHSEQINDITVNAFNESSAYKALIFTASNDKTVKIWKYRQ